MKSSDKNTDPNRNSDASNAPARPAPVSRRAAIARMAAAAALPAVVFRATGADAQPGFPGGVGDT